MKDSAGIYKHYDNNFKLTEAHVRKIYSIMSDFASKSNNDAYVSIYVDRENNSYIETKDFEKVLTEENICGKAITTFSMEIIEKNLDGEYNKKDSKAAIGFMKDKETKIKFGASYDDRDWCFLLADELDSQIQRVVKKKPLSDRATRLLNLILAISILVVPLAWLAFFNDTTSTQTIELEELLRYSIDEKLNYLIEARYNTDGFNLIGFISSFTLLFVAFFYVLEFRPLEKLQKISNTSVFYWGDVIATHDAFTQKVSKIKWGIVIAFLVSLTATIIGAKLI